jgi:histidyl-tRNA synthetase
MIKRVFGHLGIRDYSIKINNRKILTGISEVIGEAGREGELCVAIDKLDKIGWEKVQEELAQRNFNQESIAHLAPIVSLQSDIEGKIGFLKTFLADSEIGLKGIAELEEVFSLLQTYGETQANVDFDVVLARGLTYYTGAIFEVKVHGVSIGSVSGGGRYDNLTGVFGMPGVPGVGFSFGVDRLYDVMDELGLFPSDSLEGTKTLICHFDQNGFEYGLSVLGKLRQAGISAELYPDTGKIKKQLDYANKKQIPFAMILGDDEISQKKVSLKDLGAGLQETLDISEAISRLK